MGDPVWFIVVNPASGGGAARRRWPVLRAELEGRGVGYRVVMTDAPGHATALAREAVQQGARHLLAVGGDGTLHELVNGLSTADGTIHSDVVASIAPFGSGNDWARNQQVPRDPARLAAAMAECRTRQVDLGLVSCTGAGGERRTLVFHNAAGAGLDAAVVRASPRQGPRVAAYAIGLARALPGFRAPQFKIAADEQRRTGQYLAVIAAIGRDCGGGMRIAPAARADDGEFDLVTAANLGLWRALALAPGLWNGKAAADPAFQMIRCTNATIAASPDCEAEADGQPVGRTPLELRILPGALCTLDFRTTAASLLPHQLLQSTGA
ncbi:MAG: diacylglycerol kinase family protein [Steroidobacteraceae bacterium]